MEVIKTKTFKWVVGLVFGLGLIGTSFANPTEAFAGCHGSYSNGSGEIVACE